MPELPEVETIKNELLPFVVGHRITGVTLFWDRVIRYPSLERFRSGVIGQGITGLERRGKYLIFGLTSSEVLIVHLKITGSLLLKPASAEPGKFVRAIIFLDTGDGLFFRDPRKFGRMWLVADRNAVVGRLGIDPMEPGFTAQVLAQGLPKRAAPIKVILLDQTFIAGIGNMYADEALFLARIHPLRPGKSLSMDEVERLHRAIQQVLLKGIKAKGASEATYIRPSGELGTAHLEFQVAHRRGKPCPVCGTPIQRLPIRNRGSYFCPHCQTAP